MLYAGKSAKNGRTMHQTMTGATMRHDGDKY